MRDRMKELRHPGLRADVRVLLGALFAGDGLA
jgi:hypothetical protein